MELRAAQLLKPPVCGLPPGWTPAYCQQLRTFYMARPAAAAAARPALRPPKSRTVPSSPALSPAPPRPARARRRRRRRRWRPCSPTGAWSPYAAPAPLCSSAAGPPLREGPPLGRRSPAASSATAPATSSRWRTPPATVRGARGRGCARASFAGCPVRSCPRQLVRPCPSRGSAPAPPIRGGPAHPRLRGWRSLSLSTQLAAARRPRQVLLKVLANGPGFRQARRRPSRPNPRPAAPAAPHRARSAQERRAAHWLGTRRGTAGPPGRGGRGRCLLCM